MANLGSQINVMVDTETKNEASKILNDLGLSMSSAINIFLKQVIKVDGLPFEVKNHKPSMELLNALKEAEDIEKHPGDYPTYHNVGELMAVLEDAAEYNKK